MLSYDAVFVNFIVSDYIIRILDKDLVACNGGIRIYLVTCITYCKSAVIYSVILAMLYRFKYRFEI